MSRTALILAVSCAFASADALANNRGLDRAVADLATCKSTDSQVCRGLPDRLSEYGASAVIRIERIFAKLPEAAQLFGALAIRRIKGTRATNALVHLVKGPTLVIQVLAITELGKRRGTKVDRALIRALADPTPSIRANAAEALGTKKRFRNVRTAGTALLRSAKDPVQEVRIKSLESLGLLAYGKAFEPLISALKAEGERERQAALLGLRFLGEKRAVPNIIEVLRDRNETVYTEAGMTLKRLTGESFGTDYELWKAWWKSQNKKDKNESRRHR